MANKFSNEQLLMLKNAGFTAEEISLFEFNPKYAPTADELEAIMAVNSIAKTLEDIPENKQEFFNEINNTYGVLIDENLPQEELEKRVKLLAKQNPKLAKQVASLFVLIDFADNSEEE